MGTSHHELQTGHTAAICEGDPCDVLKTFRENCRRLVIKREGTQI